MILTLSVVVVAIWCMYAQSVPLSNHELSATGKLKWLTTPKFGFKPFQDICTYFGTEVSESDFETIISKQDFDLLYACLEKKKRDFTPKELSRLFHLSDFCMASPTVVNRILYLYRQSSDTLEFLRLQYPFFSPKAMEYFKNKTNSIIKIIENEIVIDCIGKNEFSDYELLSELLPAFDSLVIKNLSIDLDTLVKLQAILTSNLKCIKFENCPMLFTYDSNEQFHFHHLTQLTHFQFSGCYCKKFLSVMDALPLHQLVHLDISNNIFSENEIKKIMDTLKHMDRLESLIASSNSDSDWRLPTFTGEVLHLSNLKALDLSGNLDVKSFSDELSKSTGNSKLKYLNISRNFNNLNKEIFGNLSKFSALIVLSLPSIETDKELELLIENVKKLEFIEEIIFEEISDSYLRRLMDELKDKKLVFKSSTNSDYWFNPTTIDQLIRTDRIYLYDSNSRDIAAMQHSDQFDTTSLYVGKINFTVDNSKFLFDFFSKFESLEHLKIEVVDYNSLIILD